MRVLAAIKNDDDRSGAVITRKYMQEREIRKVIQRGDRRYVQKYAHEICEKDILLWDGKKCGLEVVAFIKKTLRSSGRVLLTIEYIYPLSVQVAAQHFLTHDDVQSVDFERHTIVTTR